MVKTGTKTSPKLEERGITCVMVGCATDHEGDCCEMLNVETNRILLSRDVQWLNRMHFNGNDIKEEEEEDLIVNNKNEIVNNKLVARQPVAQQVVAQTATTATTRSGGAIRAPARLLEEMKATKLMKHPKSWLLELESEVDLFTPVN